MTCAFLILFYSPLLSHYLILLIPQGGHACAVCLVTMPTSPASHGVGTVGDRMMMTLCPYCAQTIMPANLYSCVEGEGGGEEGGRRRY